MNLLDDIYYQKEYINLYLKDNEEIFEFKFEEDNHFFYNISIKRPILKIGNKKLKENYYDLETAYGYGGIICNTKDVNFITKAFNAYKVECLSQNIIAEFIRVHPYNTTFNNLKPFCDLYVSDRDTISVNTTINEEKRWETYPSKIRTILRKCKRELHFEKSNNIDSFIELYHKTMSKNKADSFYYFNDSYFKNLIKLKNIDLYIVKYNDTIIAASFFMFGKKIGHYHLSATDYNYRKHNANYFILDSIFNIAHQNKVDSFHLGGGRTPNHDDTLLKFKRKFSPITKNFYLGGIIFNNDRYQNYLKIWQQQTTKKVNYFLKYRLEIDE